ncbi:uncharacterized protein BYT42DRAFT_609798 [Radiomyces spectabilis]|uniref:uncharacterized protein n=1 Tax=Radiomyces spectabilis TaxID=64574 RepID=UPI00221FDC12|nr:uncharacterized protein BYT42DRAFT_609798 [Radiomyces spectabilis]KAI8394042.1 hypothetical protein BYT42DRAFT_609798 [Radiomyces spectabilis]
MDDSSHSGNMGTVILFKKVCPDCEEQFNRFQDMKRHIFSKHGKDLTPRTNKDHGKSVDGFPVHVYNESNVKKYTKQRTTVIIKFACPSCNGLFNEASELSHHVNNNHIKIPPSLEDVPPAENRWLVQGHDVSTKFHDYRQMCILASRTTDFAIETHFNELLAMSGILVLQRRDSYKDLPADVFPPSLLTAARNETRKL